MVWYIMTAQSRVIVWRYIVFHSESTHSPVYAKRMMWYPALLLNTRLDAVLLLNTRMDVALLLNTTRMSMILLTNSRMPVVLLLNTRLYVILLLNTRLLSTTTYFIGDIFYHILFQSCKFAFC